MLKNFRIKKQLLPPNPLAAKPLNFFPRLFLLSFLMLFGYLLFYSAKGMYSLFLPASDKLYFQFFEFPEVFGDAADESLPTNPLLMSNYVATSGDTYWMIAKRTGLSIDTIISFNKPEKAYKLDLGESVKIPSLNGLLLEEVYSEEKFQALAQRYHLSKQKVLFFNPLWQNKKSKGQVFVPEARFLLGERMQILGGEFSKPLQQEVRFSSLFGVRIHPLTKKRSFHKGIDMRANIGSTVLAALGGKIIFSGTQSGYGNVIIILHSKNRLSKYAHLSKLFVAIGKKVQRGQIIGEVGNTGMATGAHLHFEIWKEGKAFDPRDITDFY